VVGIVVNKNLSAVERLQEGDLVVAHSDIDDVWVETLVG